MHAQLEDRVVRGSDTPRFRVLCKNAASGFPFQRGTNENAAAAESSYPVSSVLERRLHGMEASAASSPLQLLLLSSRLQSQRVLLSKHASKTRLDLPHPPRLLICLPAQSPSLTKRGAQGRFQSVLMDFLHA